MSPLIEPRRSALLLLLGAVVAARVCCGAAPASRFAPRPPPSGGAGSVFDLVESLAPGSHILVSLDYAPGAEAETQAIAEAVLRHAFTRGCRVHVMTLWATGESAAARSLEAALARTPQPKAYSRDYVVLGFKAGGSGAINALVTDFRGLVTTDMLGASIDAMEIMRGIDGLDDYGLVVTVSAGAPGAKEWAQFAGGRAAPWPPIAAAVAAIDAPALLPYVPRRLAALTSGLAGAAEYEHRLGSVGESARLLAGAAEHERPAEDALSLAPAQVAGEAVFLALIVAALLAPALARAPGIARPSSR